MTRKASGSVLELQSLPSFVTGCFARAETLDRFDDGHADFAVRVAADELLLFGADLAPQAVASVLTVDLSSAFAIWALRGDGRQEAFRRLSAVELPECGVLQCLVASVPAKVVVRDDELLFIVPSTVSQHIRGRILLACADLEPVEGTQARPEETLV